MKKLMISLICASISFAFAGEDRVNLAGDRPGTASSRETAEYAPEKAVDGNDKTRWSSGRSDNEWIMVDLGEMKTVGKVVLKWEHAAGKDYLIRFSADGKSFTDVATKKDGKPGAVETLVFRPAETRFIRVEGRKRTTQYGYSLWEIEAYAPGAGDIINAWPPGENFAANAKATASSLEKAGFEPVKAVDNNGKTRWSSDRNDNEWIMLEFSEPREIGRVILKWEQAAGKEYKIQLSDDGAAFRDVFTKTDGKPGAVETISFEPESAKFVRIQGQKRATQYGYSLWEIEVYTR